jgi:hypothetical protein
MPTVRNSCFRSGLHTSSPGGHPGKPYLKVDRQQTSTGSCSLRATDQTETSDHRVGSTLRRRRQQTRKHQRWTCRRRRRRLARAGHHCVQGKARPLWRWLQWGRQRRASTGTLTPVSYDSQANLPTRWKANADTSAVALRLPGTRFGKQ